jgi:hypothetical protein
VPAAVSCCTEPQNRRLTAGPRSPGGPWAPPLVPPLAIIASNVLENYYRDEERELGNDIAAGFLDPTEGKR